MLCRTGAIGLDPESVKTLRQARIDALREHNYCEFFKRASTELIANRTTLYRRVVNEIEIGNIDGMYGELCKKRPRYVIRDRDE